MPPPKLSKGPRAYTVGAALEFIGKAVAIFGLSTSLTYTANGPTYSPSPGVALIGVLIAFIGLILHIARV